MYVDIIMSFDECHHVLITTKVLWSADVNILFWSMSLSPMNNKVSLVSLWSILILSCWQFLKYVLPLWVLAFWLILLWFTSLCQSVFACFGHCIMFVICLLPPFPYCLNVHIGSVKQSSLWLCWAHHLSVVC